MLNLCINGKEVRVDGGTTLAMLLAQKGINPETVVVEYNNTIVNQAQWPDITLQSGDKLEIVAFVGGG